MQQFAINGDNNQNSKRPHIRKAHWERYHIGKGRKDIITKWKEPVFINGDYNDITANGGELTSSLNEAINSETLKRLTDNDGIINFFFCQDFIKPFCHVRQTIIIRKWS